MKHITHWIKVFTFLVFSTLLFSATAQAATTLSIKTTTWNVIGLDSNKVTEGPNLYPVGVLVCNTGGEDATNVVVDYVWDSANPYIELQAGTPSSYTIDTLAAGECKDVYFNVEVTRDSNAYDTTREYHITATADNSPTVSTPTPRELYIEYLVSQNRNSIDSVSLDGTDVPAGSTMNLVEGETYLLTFVRDTAVGGYEQLETYLTLNGIIFQINSVTTTYTQDDGTDPDAGCNSMQMAVLGMRTLQVPPTESVWRRGNTVERLPQSITLLY